MQLTHDMSAQQPMQAPRAHPQTGWRTCALAILSIAVMLWVSLAPKTAHAEAMISVAGGSASESSAAWRLGVRRPWERRWFNGGSAHLTGYWEASVAHFNNSSTTPQPGVDATARLWNVALAPVWRLQFNLNNGRAIVQPFLDLGVGVSFVSNRSFRSTGRRNRELGSFFQFEDRGAVGARIGNWEVAYQRMHFSNLNFASDNAGIDAHLLLISRSLFTGRR